MCLMVYLGSDAPLPHGDPGATVVALNAAETAPAGMEGKPHVYEVVTWGGGRACCSCTFQDHIMPWEDASALDMDDPEVATTVTDFARLRGFCRAALEADPAPLLLCLWDGEETRPPQEVRDAVPEDFAPGRFAFADTDRGGDAHRLFRLHAGEPE